MTSLGRELGQVIARQLPETGRVVLAFTVEDADFLATGVIESFKTVRPEVKFSLACFWNHRVRIGKTMPIEQAPIVRQYVEPHPRRVDALVMVKSIIGTSCVVRTNLMRLLDDTSPRRIFVASPVMFSEARPNLEGEFPARIVNRFTYVYFATDTEMRGGMVVPGVGGSVYELLGVGTSQTKNRFRPELVVTRRQDHVAR